MDAIIRGTTPTIEFKFDEEVQVSDITSAFLMVYQNNAQKIEKDFNSATILNNSVCWSLSQADTLSLMADREVVGRCKWKLASGVVGVSEKLVAMVENSGKDEEI